MGCQSSKYVAEAEVKKPISSPKRPSATAAPDGPTSHGTSEQGYLSESSGSTQTRDRAQSNESSQRRRGSTEVLDKIRDSPSREGNVANSRIIRHKTIDEVYQIEEDVLGNGLNGAVRLVVNKSNGRKAALKSLSTVNMSTKRFELLYNEVDLYLKLDHPNICKLLEVYEDEQAVHLLMELCTGKELYERLATKKRYSERDCIHAVFQMLQALHYMHWHKMVHRDLKLENWVYSDDKAEEDSKLKLIDFGFAKIFLPGLVMTAMHGTLYYVAPEVMEGCYDHKCDIWSIGVIVYMLLSGAPPFAGQTDDEIAQKIKRGKFTFQNQRWVNISEDAKNFIQFLMRREPVERPSAQEALGHTWLKLENDEHHTAEISMDVLSNIQHFSTMNTLKRAACGLIAFSLSSKEMQDLELQFEKLDTEKNGTILIHELTSALVEHLNMSESEAQKIFNRLDQTGDHEIHYSEFLAASLQHKFLTQEGILRDAFNKFDVDSTGFISVDNLRTVLGDVYNGTRVEDIISEVDIKKNGVIDYDEFVQAVMDNGIGKGGDDESDTFEVIRKISKTFARPEDAETRSTSKEPRPTSKEPSPSYLLEHSSHASL